MKILFLFHRNLETATGGVVEFLHQLPLALKPLGIESVIYHQADKHAKTLSGPKLLANGIRYYSGPFVEPKLFINARQLGPILKLCELENIDVVHAQTTYRAGYLAMQVNKRNGIPYIITSHNDILTTNSPRMKKISVRHRCRNILKHASAVTHLTTLMRDASHTLCETHKKDFIIGNGIDLKEWQAFLNLPEKNYMLAIGRIEIGKGFDILINAYARLQKQDVTTALVIAGDGAARESLQTQMAQLNLKNIIFTGYVKGDEKRNLYAKAKIILFATQPDAWAEAFSIVQLESMAAGKAMIASDTPSTRYLQSLGLQTSLVPPADVKAWAEHMRLLLDNDELRRHMAQRNLENARHFDWQRIAEQYRDVYRFVVE